MASTPQNIRRQDSSTKWFRNLTIFMLTGFVLWKTIPPLFGVLTLFMIALIFSYLLEPVVSALENRGLPRIFSIITLFIFISFLLYFAGYFLFIPLKAEMTDLINRVQGENINKVAGQVKSFIITNFPFIQSAQIDNSINDLLSVFQNAVLSLSRSSLTFLQGILSVLTQIIIIPLIAFFILKDGPMLKKKFLDLVPNKYFEMLLHLFYKTDKQIGSFIRGQIVDNMILAVFYSIGYYFMDIPFFIIFGAFSGLANVIPYVGPVLGALPPVIVTIMEFGDFSMIPAIILLFVIVQILENGVVQPTVVAKSVNLHPLIIIFSVLTGGQLLGVIGMLFSVLLAGIIKVLIVEISWSYKNYDFGKTYMRDDNVLLLPRTKNQ